LKKKFKHIGIFISDDGNGHAVRQIQIIIFLIKKNFNVTVVTNKKILRIKKYFKNKISYINLHNLIETKKNKIGGLDKQKTMANFLHWFYQKKKWNKKVEKIIVNFDLVISDSVPQVYILTKKYNIPSINISHFTWDWFYRKLFFHKNKKIYQSLCLDYSMCDYFLFPPLTPEEILQKYKNKVFNLNIITTDSFFKIKYFKKKTQCLIMDNGSNVMAENIKKIIPYILNLPINFYIGCDSLQRKSIDLIAKTNNCKIISGYKNVHKKLAVVDFVIARGGFNTISECLVLKKPSLLYEENDNPEVKENIKILRKNKLCSKISKYDFGENISNKINKFLKNEFVQIQKTFNKIKFLENGAMEATEFIEKIILKK
jgi:uncharacterized protein (TIGR00661 family)